MMDHPLYWELYESTNTHPIDVIFGHVNDVEHLANQMCVLTMEGCRRLNWDIEEVARRLRQRCGICVTLTPIPEDLTTIPFKKPPQQLKDSFFVVSINGVDTYVANFDLIHNQGERTCHQNFTF